MISRFSASFLVVSVWLLGKLRSVGIKRKNFGVRLVFFEFLASNIGPIQNVCYCTLLEFYITVFRRLICEFRIFDICYVE